MRARDLVHETSTALLANKGRSALTILGIVVGIMAVVIMVSLITGFESWLENNIGLGSARVVTITSKDENISLSTDDVSFLERVVDELDTVLPEATATASVEPQTSSKSSSTGTTDVSSTETTSTAVSLTMLGVDSAYFSLQNTTLAVGSVYTDDAGTAIVLSQGAVESIYGDSSANVTGQSITIANNEYEIVGVAESGALLSGASAAIAYVPYDTLCNAFLGGEQRVDSLLAHVKSNEDVGSAAAKAQGALAARYSVEYSEDGTQSAISAATTESTLSYLQTFTIAFDALAALVAAIALLVGGIGIMNMMLTNVTERIREIGLRKSLGARPIDVEIQFLAESVALCVAGGVVGIAAGYAGAWGITGIVGQLFPTLSGLVPIVSPALVGIVFAVCAAIGIIFGFYPARRASKLNPSETLRYQ